MKTMRDVAAKAGVSPTTVSLVLSGRQPANGAISSQTQERVWEAARELGYRRNALVQAVVSGRNRSLGFMSRHLEYEFTARLLGGSLQEATESGYSLQLMALQSNSIDRAAIERCLEMRLAGLLTSDIDREALDYLHAEMKPHGVPIVFMDTSFRQEWGIHVTSDDAQGCRLAIEHLAALGHRRIGFIGGDPVRGMATVRERGYREAMALLGLQVLEADIGCGFWNSSGAEPCAYRILEGASRPSAIFCANDDMAVGVQRVARRLGLQMPHDLSVVGFADMTSATLADPPLTTVAQPITEMGRVATKLLLEQLEPRSGGAERDIYAPQEKLLPNRLVVRDSTSACSVPS